MTTNPLTVRAMIWDDIPHIRRIAEESPSCWIRPDFLTVFQSNETLGFVAQRGDRIAGFLLCTVHRLSIDSNHSSWNPLKRCWRLIAYLINGTTGSSRRISLFGMGTATGFSESDTQRALLKQFDHGLRQPADRIEAVVPETDVVAQSVLRVAGFSAVRVLRGYYLHVDGYLMARDNSELAATIDHADRAPRAHRNERYIQEPS
jgi:hypothetical protein